MPIVIAPGSQTDLGFLRLMDSNMHDVSARRPRGLELVPGSHRVRIGNSTRLPASEMRAAIERSSPELARRMAGKDVPALVSNTITIDVPEPPLLAMQPFTVSLPREVDPQTVVIDYGFRIGDGMSGGWLTAQAGVFDYVIKPDTDLGTPTLLKLAIYIPGYRMVTPEFSGEVLQAGKTYVPQLVQLPTMTLKGRLVDSAGNALVNEQLKVDYILTEVMGYHGYADGMVPTIHVADTRTDGDGRFELDVPSLLDDPFFADTRSPGNFQFSHDADARGRDFTLDPNTLHVQKAYEPLTIRKTRMGTLAGKLGMQFRRQNNVPELGKLQARVTPSDATKQVIVPGEMEKGARRPLNPVPTFHALVDTDGAFELRVPAGTYDIGVWVPEDNRFIPVERGVVLEEDRRRELERP